MSPQTLSAADGDGTAGGAGLGLGGLREEVSTCEYHDVHVMWEMLSAGNSSSSSTSTSTSKATKKKKGRRRGSLPVVAWSRLLSYCCGARSDLTSPALPCSALCSSSPPETSSTEEKNLMR
jgi:hypothetical protein